jgi:hypothetical protein
MLDSFRIILLQVNLKIDTMKKMFYQIYQYGQLRCTHHDIEYNTEEQARKVCRRVVKKAKQAVEDGSMVEGSFEVQICDEQGTELDSFISDTNYNY